MTKTAKIIIITSLVTLAAGATGFYFLVWRKRKGVGKEDADILKGYKVEEQPIPAEALRLAMSLPISI